MRDEIEACKEKNEPSRHQHREHDEDAGEQLEENQEHAQVHHEGQELFLRALHHRYDRISGQDYHHLRRLQSPHQLARQHLKTSRQVEPQGFPSQPQPRLDRNLQSRRSSTRENGYRQGQEGRSEQDYVALQGGFQDSFGGFQPGEEGGEEEAALGADVGVDLDDSLDGLAAGELCGAVFFG